MDNNNGTTNYTTVEATGGSPYIQNHTHDIRWSDQTGRRVLMSYTSGSTPAFDLGGWQSVNATSSDTTPTNLMAGKLHDPNSFALMNTGNEGNMPPYVTCYMYKRTA